MGTSSHRTAVGLAPTRTEAFSSVAESSTPARRNTSALVGVVVLAVAETVDVIISVALAYQASVNKGVHGAVWLAVVALVKLVAVAVLAVVVVRVERLRQRLVWMLWGVNTVVVVLVTTKLFVFVR